MVFFIAVHILLAVVEVVVSLHVDVAQLIGHLIAVVLVEEGQVAEHEIIALLLASNNGVLHMVLLRHFSVDIHLRHRINLILNWNLRLLDSCLSSWVELAH
jgi:hypothetical protein